MTDRELLELAAKAANLETGHKWNAERLELEPPVVSLVVTRNGALVSTAWNPLINDGDALRLAVRLSMLCEFSCSGMTVEAPSGPGPLSEFEDYRRAIVRAAAEIGRAMP